ncbi:carbohydrate esterase family 9 protein [Myriangium duriaei CBS 260.36]|uniref:N-acetylglucosamine-6-phosphate deacetylase n=1 Tax=Myriangium duriaei CBS 260.36 TaxID=1168546 RepID=A0A9P4MKH6_9PEZI|nr:carbohydrate esterase family 9 protein [Myriangium duriaei CBS 260.36]
MSTNVFAQADTYVAARCIMSPGKLLETARSGIVRLTGCVSVNGAEAGSKDVLFDRSTGKIINGQHLFYGNGVTADEVIDLGGRIVCPGFIDVQFNGAFNFDFSDPSRGPDAYSAQLRDLNTKIIKTGVTSYLPTVTSQKKEVYHKTLPFLGPSGWQRHPSEGAESLGAHCEGPFISPGKNGIHNLDVLRTGLDGYPDLEDCYGSSNLRGAKGRPPRVKMVTAAPEVGSILKAIPEIADRGIVVAVGHSEATYDEAAAALEAGSTMVTHLFNQMAPLHHRTPGIFGLLGRTNREYRPYFGIIADGIHLHPSVVKLAYTSHPDGLILVTDAMSLLGLEDGTYDWTNGDRIIKRGSKLILEGTDRIAGGTATLLDCVNNFLNWSGVSIAEAVKTVTETPAKMLGLEKTKGVLSPGADADFVVLDYKRKADGELALEIYQVWKFGELVYQQDNAAS